METRKKKTLADHFMLLWQVLRPVPGPLLIHTLNYAAVDQRVPTIVIVFVSSPGVISIMG